MAANAGAVGNALGNAIQSFGAHSAQAAANANGVSAAAQAAQGQFNQGSANLANSIGSDRIAQQYAFNAAQVGMANDLSASSWNNAAAYNQNMWQMSADWNSETLEKIMEFNAMEAQKQRDWQQKMMETAYQRAVKDMTTAGLNPILAVGGGGISVGSGGGSGASVGNMSMSPVTMSPIAGQAASGGLMNAAQASEGNYTGQMEYMGGMLGLLAAAISGLSSATTAFGGMGKVGESIANAIGNIFNTDQYEDTNKNGLWDEFKKDFSKHPSWYYDHRYDQ